MLPYLKRLINMDATDRQESGRRQSSAAKVKAVAFACMNYFNCVGALLFNIHRCILELKRKFRGIGARVTEPAYPESYHGKYGFS
jgi:hypothetical protein